MRGRARKVERRPGGRSSAGAPGEPGAPDAPAAATLVGRPITMVSVLDTHSATITATSIASTSIAIDPAETRLR